MYVPGEWVSALRDGVVLCELCNKLRPGIVPHINRSTKVRTPLSTPNSFLVFCSFVVRWAFFLRVQIHVLMVSLVTIMGRKRAILKEEHSFDVSLGFNFN